MDTYGYITLTDLCTQQWKHQIRTWDSAPWTGDQEQATDLLYILRHSCCY